MVRRLVLAALLLLPACGMPAGRADLLAFLTDGVTRKEDVFLRLGEPSATFEREQILTYRIGRDEGGYFIERPGANPLVTSQHSLVLVFGENGVLRRHALVDLKATPG